MQVRPLYIVGNYAFVGNAAARKTQGVNQSTTDAQTSTDPTVATESKPTERPADEVDFSAEAQQILEDLSPEEQEQVDKLEARDREVRTHEQAHLAAAGQYARGGPTYTYQRGPDGQRYAIGGEVQIDTSPVANDPEATIRKAQVVRAAALAPAEPSSQDRAVAAAASQMEAQARVQLQKSENPQASSQTSSNNAPQQTGNSKQAANNQAASTQFESEFEYDASSRIEQDSDSLLDVVL